MTKERLNSISIKFTLSCTTWPSFSFTCRLLFIISTLKLVVSWKFLSIRIVLSCFYLLIFYFEKFSTWIWRLPFAVYVKRGLEHKPQKDKEISIVSYSARENHTAKLNWGHWSKAKDSGTASVWAFVFSSYIVFDRGKGLTDLWFERIVNR